jgi:glutathione S-transferase
MRLYDTQRSGNAWKVRLMAGLLGIELPRVTLSIDKGDLRDPAFVGRHPLRQVPILELDDGSTLSESLAILFYLAEGSAFWPAEKLERSHVLTWLSFEQARHMRPLAQLRLHLSLRRDKKPDDPDMRACRAEAIDALDRLNEQLGRQGRDEWVATKGHPSIADVALYPYTRMASLGGVDLQVFPNLEPWLRQVERLRGYQPLFPSRPDMNLSTREIDTP